MHKIKEHITGGDTGAVYKLSICWFVPFSDLDSDIWFYLTNQLTEQSQVLENFKFYTFSE